MPPPLFFYPPTHARLLPVDDDHVRQCPATGEELTTDDLLELRSDKAVKPRPVEAASIPGLLAIMQVGASRAVCLGL